MIKEGMRKGGKENSRRECVYIYIYIWDIKRERKSERVYTRSYATDGFF